MMRKNYAMAIAVCATLAMLPAPGTAKADSLKDKMDNLQISGFVDASTAWSNVNSKTTTGAANSWGTGLDQVELDITYTKGNVGLRFDFNILPTTPPTALNNVNNQLLEQGYMTYTVPGILKDGLTFTYGKFNAPIGWELLDPTDMYQYSHSLTFNYALPTNLIGGMVTGAYGMVDVAAYYVNHADSNGIQTKGMKTLGGRLGITPMDGANIGFSYLRDNTANGTTGQPAATIFDIDATYTGVSGLTLGGEYNQGRGWRGVTATNTQIKSESWFLVANYAINDTFGVTARYEQANFDKSTKGKTTAYTGAVTASLGEGYGMLVELRSDKNSKTAADPNGTPANKTVNSAAMEMTYAF